MCLDLINNAIKQIASEDIICYKRIIRHVDFSSYVGKSFTGIIDDIECEGIIQIENNYTYFCTNDPRLDGWACKNKLGYSYSGNFIGRIMSIIIDGIDIMNNGINFTTPYQGAEVKLGETYTSKLIREDRIGHDIINIGLHSYANYETAVNDGAGVIVKCIIPKGSEYYLGDFNGCKSYASNQLKYLEIVKE